MGISEVSLFDRYRTQGVSHNFELRRHSGPEYQESILGPFARLVFRHKRNSQVLDLASGKGEAGDFLEKNFHFRVIRSDISLLGLQSAKKDRVKNLAQSLPFADSSFDAIHFKDAIVHFDDKVSLLHEIRRILKPNGFLLIVSHEQSNGSWATLEKRVAEKR